MPDYLRFPLVLALVAAIAGASLAGVQLVTSKRIEENKSAKLNEALKTVPGYGKSGSSQAVQLSSELQKKYGKNAKCFKLLNGSGKLLGYAAEVACSQPQCFNTSDPITLVVAISADKKLITVVRTTNNKETPGLGTKVSARKPQKVLFGQVDPAMKDFPFLDLFKGQPTKKLQINKNGIDAITGATVSSKAVLGGVNLAVSLIRETCGN